MDGLRSVVWEKQGEQTTEYVAGAKLGEPRKARAPENPLPHHAHRAPGRHHRCLQPTFGVESLCHQYGAHATVFAGSGVGYRNAYRVERIFNRLKSRVHIAPLCVKRNEQIESLTYLLTLGSVC